LSRKNKTKFKKSAPIEETVEPAETEEEVFEEEAETEEEDVKEESETGEDEVNSEEIEDGDEEIEDEETTPPKIKKTMLFVGIAFYLIGLFGVAGLRSGILQLALGDSNPYPGVGSVEPMGHVVSMTPLVIGFVLIALWGIRNDPIYEEIEKLKEENADIAPDEISEEEITEDDVDSDIPAEEEIPEEFHEPITDLSDEQSEHLGEFGELASLEEVLGDAIDEAVQQESEIEKKVSKTEDKAMSDSMKNALAEEMRIERCEKMLSVAVVLPDDKEHMKTLIAGGILAQDFTEEVKKAIDRRKKREQEKDVTAAEKASILEDELVAELTELGDDLDNDRKEEDLEDQILKEIEDLENL